MSGGSFNYVSCGDADVITSERHSFAEMVAAMQKHAPGHPATQESLRLQNSFDQLQNLDERLTRVWHALEWWYSGDWGEEDFREALDAYLPLESNLLGQSNMFLTVAGMADQPSRLSELKGGEFVTVATYPCAGIEFIVQWAAGIIISRHSKPRLLVVQEFGLGGAVLDALKAHRAANVADWGRCEVVGG